MSTVATARSALERYLHDLPRSADGGHAVWTTPEGRVAGRFLRSSLSSVFQPLIHLDSGREIGHEAFIRSFDDTGGDLSPWNLFANAASDEALIELDRLCRTLHVLNYFGRAGDDASLFLNVHGRLMLAVGEDHGSAFGRVLSALDIERRRIVIESPEAMSSDLSLLAYVLLNYRYNGYRVGVNLARGEQIGELVRHVRPDFVKLDGGRDDTLRDIGRHADLCARHGIQLIVKRVGQDGLAPRLREAGVALAQGHALGRPRPATPVARRLAYSEE